MKKTILFFMGILLGFAFLGLAILSISFIYWIRLPSPSSELRSCDIEFNKCNESPDYSALIQERYQIDRTIVDRIITASETLNLNPLYFLEAVNNEIDINDEKQLDRALTQYKFIMSAPSLDQQGRVVHIDSALFPRVIIGWKGDSEIAIKVRKNLQDNAGFNYFVAKQAAKN